jgi:2-polyprenyl-3-methyl-5-hydroxy-6-metoxy-1,4-benzoquinol methylase
MSKDIFTEYYKNNTWSGKESVSGPGSDYEQTKFLIPELNIMLKSLNIKSMLDIPCGDFNWMKQVDLSKISYHGADIVEPMIERNNKKHQKKNIKFSVLDLVNDKLPKVDLIMVRDCLVHLPTNDVFKALNNIKNSGSKYLLTTNFLWNHQEANQEISVGQWRRINLQKTPYSFKYPERIIIEGNIQSHDRDKTMSLWYVKDIPDFDVDNNG